MKIIKSFNNLITYRILPFFISLAGKKYFESRKNLFMEQLLIVHPSPRNLIRIKLWNKKMELGII